MRRGAHRRAPRPFLNKPILFRVSAVVCVSSPPGWVFLGDVALSLTPCTMFLSVRPSAFAGVAAAFPGRGPRCGRLLTLCSVKTLRTLSSAISTHWSMCLGGFSSGLRLHFCSVGRGQIFGRCLIMVCLLSRGLLIKGPAILLLLLLFDLDRILALSSSGIFRHLHRHFSCSHSSSSSSSQLLSFIIIMPSSSIPEGFSLAPALGNDCFFDTRADGDEPFSACLLHIRVCSSYLEESLHAVVIKSPVICDMEGKAPMGYLAPGWNSFPTLPARGSRVGSLPSRYLASSVLPIVGLCMGDPSLPYGCLSGESSQCSACFRFESADRLAWSASVKCVREVYPDVGVKEVYCRLKDTVKAWIAAGYALSAGEGSGLTRLAPTSECVIAGLVSREGRTGSRFCRGLRPETILPSASAYEDDSKYVLSGFPVGPSSWGAVRHPPRRGAPGIDLLTEMGSLAARKYFLSPSASPPGANGPSSSRQ